jgi:uncharacterized protein (TIGR03083 family)
MTDEAYIRTLRTHTDAVATAAAAAELDARVPSCPEWTVYDLLAHLGRHHRWVTANLDRAPDDGPAPAADQGAPPDGRAVVPWIEQGSAALADRLVAVDAATPCWTWTDDRTARFWARRTAHETAMHRWDLQAAVGDPTPFPPELAVDGIDEFLTTMPFRGGADAPVGSVHLHATDAEGEWLLRLADDGVRMSREHGKGDVAVRGPASDLLLVVVGRRPPATVELFGDAALFDQWRAVMTF